MSLKNVRMRKMWMLDKKNWLQKKECRQRAYEALGEMEE